MSGNDITGRLALPSIRRLPKAAVGVVPPLLPPLLLILPLAPFLTEVVGAATPECTVKAGDDMAGGNWSRGAFASTAALAVDGPVDAAVAAGDCKKL